MHKLIKGMKQWWLQVAKGIAACNRHQHFGKF